MKLLYHNLSKLKIGHIERIYFSIFILSIFLVPLFICEILPFNNYHSIVVLAAIIALYLILHLYKYIKSPKPLIILNRIGDLDEEIEDKCN
jgi:hypothetical protein